MLSSRIVPVLALLVAGSASAQTSLLRIVTEGDQAFGTAIGGMAVFRSFDRAVIGDGGHVFIEANLNFGDGVWVWDNGDLTNVVHDDQPLPEINWSVLDYELHSVNIHGDAVLTANNRRLVLRYRHGHGLEVVGQETDPAPGLPGSTYRFFNEARINDRGQIAFEVQLRGAGGVTGYALYLHDDGDSTLLVSQDGPAPGTGGQPITSPTRLLSLSEYGGVSFYSTFLRVGDHPPSNSHVETIWVTARPVSAPDGSIPETLPVTAPAGPAFDTEDPFFREILAPLDRVTSHIGDVAFVGRSRQLVAPGAPDHTGRGIWKTIEGRAHRVAVYGSTAADTRGARFRGFDWTMFNALGDAVFRAALFMDDPGVTPENDIGLWVDPGEGEQSLILRQDDPAPGTDERFTQFEHVQLSDGGDVLLNCRLTDARRGLWHYSTRTRSLRKILDTEDRLNTTIDGGPHNFQGVNGVASAGGNGTRGVNKQGQISLIVGFENGTSSVYIAQVPLPGVTPCTGDCDGSGAVDFEDLVATLFAFGQVASAACDSDASGDIGFDDVVSTLFRIGACD